MSPRRDKVVCILFAIKGLLFAAVCVFFLFQVWTDRSAYLAMLDHGVETNAYITGAKVNSGPHAKTYLVNISWLDRSGQQRTRDNISLSATFWEKLVSGNVLVQRYIAIRYLEKNPEARPLVVLDSEEKMSKNTEYIYTLSGLVTLGVVLFGVCTLLAIRMSRKQESNKAL